MTDQATTSGPSIVVLGASGTIGREIARLAVAYGCEVIGMTRAGSAPTDEPWTAGVEWIACDARDPTLNSQIANARVVIDATPTDVVGAARSLEVDRVVELGCAAARITDRIPAHVIHLLIPRLDPRAERGEKLPDSSGIATAHAAMAALRVAIEDDHAGTIEPGRVAELGDAMFLQ